MTAFSLPTEILISSNSKTNFSNRAFVEIARLLCFSLSSDDIWTMGLRDTSNCDKWDIPDMGIPKDKHDY
jgi:hypothetical protein